MTSPASANTVIRYIDGEAHYLCPRCKNWNPEGAHTCKPAAPVDIEKLIVDLAEKQYARGFLDGDGTNAISPPEKIREGMNLCAAARSALLDAISRMVGEERAAYENERARRRKLGKDMEAEVSRLRSELEEARKGKQLRVSQAEFDAVAQVTSRLPLANETYGTPLRSLLSRMFVAAE